MTARIFVPQGNHGWVVQFGNLDSIHGDVSAAVHRPDGESFGPLSRGTQQLGLISALPGHAPALAQSARYRVFFDGVLSNNAELRALLSVNPPAPETDAEVILRAYQQWDDKALERTRGQFVALVWDAEKNVLSCARDALGIHPLFAKCGRFLLFSPSIEALLAHPSVSRELNRSGMVEYLASRWLHANDTYYSQVQRVPPGHIMRVTATARRFDRYWDPLPNHDTFTLVSQDEAQSRFESALAQAIERCLDSSGNGINLSGGLDSSTVAVFATEILQSLGRPPLTGFSLVYPAPDYDEGQVQSAVADRLGLAHVQLPFERAIGSGCLAAALALTRTMPTPLTNFSRPALTRLAIEANAHGCQVVLSGQGADEWLGVVHSHAADLLRAVDLAGTYRLWKTFSKSYAFGSVVELRRTLWQFGVRQLLRNAWRRSTWMEPARTWRNQANARQIAASMPWLAPDPVLHTEFVRRMEEALNYPAVGSARGTYRKREMLAVLGDPTHWTAMEETFYATRRNGVDMRHPFWDPDLIELLVRMPADVLLRGGFTKALIRPSLARRFPDLGFERQRKNSLSPIFLSAMRAEAPTERLRLGALKTLVALGVVDANKTKVFLDHPAASGQHWWIAAWNILNLETWARSRT